MTDAIKASTYILLNFMNCLFHFLFVYRLG